MRFHHSLDSPVERCDADLPHLPSLCFLSVCFGTKAHLNRALVFGQSSKTMLDEVAFQSERLTVCYPAQRNMNMRMLSVVVCYGNPFERSAQLVFDGLHEVTREPWKVRTFTKLRRDDYFE